MQRKLFPVAPSRFQECRRLVFFLKRNRFYSFNLRCECLYYILIRFSAINIVDYLYLSTICVNRRRLTWNSNASPKIDFLHAYTKYTRSTFNTTSETANLHVIDMIWNFKRTDFFTLCQKERCVSLLIIYCDVAWYRYIVK